MDPTESKMTPDQRHAHHLAMAERDGWPVFDEVLMLTEEIGGTKAAESVRWPNGTGERYV